MAHEREPDLADAILVNIAREIAAERQIEGEQAVEWLLERIDRRTARAIVRTALGTYQEFAQGEIATPISTNSTT